MALVTEDALTVQSDLLGPLTLQQTDLWDFPTGLYGLPECRSFALIPTGRDAMYWLQSTTHTRLTFLLVDPFVYFPGYTVDLSGADLTRIGTSEPTDIMVMAIVTLPRDATQKWTANLQGPVVLNARDRQGYQCVLANDSYGVREQFEPAPFADAL
jgi:flagellar assembly factor FliW